MKILGISCYYHDAAAALISDGEIVAAAEEERFTRKKHDPSFPQNAINFCLEFSKVKPKGLDYVVFYEKPYLKFQRILLQTTATFPKSSNLFIQAMKEWLTKKLWIKQEIAERVGVDIKKIYFSDHHLSHAASAFYPSPFKRAALLTLDGVGEWSVGTWGIGNKNKIELIEELRFPHSLGLLYSTFTAFLGFEVNDGEYKVMGMAPFGKPKYIPQIKKLVKIFQDGSFQLDMSYFSFHSSPEKSFTKKFEQIFGKPRNPSDPFFTNKNGFPKFWEQKPKDYENKIVENQKYADIAASIQAVTEEIVLKICRFLAKETKLTNLCLAGGVGLNAVANGKIIKSTSFKNLFIQPAATDAGGALGAALYFYHQILGKNDRKKFKQAFLGKSYSKQEIRNFLANKKCSYKEYPNDKKLIKNVVAFLCQKKVVGWFQSRFEWGPRALGARSIIADPRFAEIKDIVNQKIKFREPFRPFAPSVLERYAKDFFEIENLKSLPGKFMTIVVPIKPGKEKLIPAVSHFGTARIQTVDSKTNSSFYQLIRQFYKSTSIPLILNTSFNLKGEPIVNSPEDALRTFEKSGLDALVLENFLILKNEDFSKT